MINLSKRLVIAITLVFTASLLLDACTAGQLVGTQSEPTPLPTIAESGEVNTEGRLVPLRSSTLSFQAGGELDKLLVSEGQVVQQGDLLAQLGKREAQEAALSQANLELLAALQALDTVKDNAALARAQSEQALVEARRVLTESQKALDDLDTEDFRSELDDRVIAIQDAKEELDNAQDDLDKYQGLDAENATRKRAQTAYDDAKSVYDDAVYERDRLQNQLDNAQAAVGLAAARLDDAQRQFDARQEGPDADEIALAQARVDNATAQVAAAQRSLDNLDLFAPYDGTVVDLYDLDPGEDVSPGKTVVTLADFSAWIVETRDLTELDVVDVEVGQDVVVVPDALPDLRLAGEVESIDRAYTERSGDILYTVRIRLKESDPLLRWGMTVTVTIEP